MLSYFSQMLSYCSLPTTFATNYKISISLHYIIHFLNIIKIILSFFSCFNTPIINYFLIYLLKINFSAFLLKFSAILAPFRHI